MVLPLTSGHCDVCVFLVPREETGESQSAVRLHRAGQHVQLGPSRAHKDFGTLQVDEEPLLEKVLRVVGQQRPLTDKLDPALHLKFWFSRGEPMAMEFGGYSCGEERENKLINRIGKFYSTNIITQSASRTQLSERILTLTEVMMTKSIQDCFHSRSLFHWWTVLASRFR